MYTTQPKNVQSTYNRYKTKNKITASAIVLKNYYIDENPQSTIFYEYHRRQVYSPIDKHNL